MNRRILTVILSPLLTLALLCGTRVARAADPATPAAIPPDAASPAAPTTQGQRGVEEIMADIKTVSTQAKDAFTPAVITDPEKRKEVAPKALPALKKMVALGKEMQGTPNKQMGDQMVS